MTVSMFKVGHVALTANKGILTFLIVSSCYISNDPTTIGPSVDEVGKISRGAKFPSQSFEMGRNRNVIKASEFCQDPWMPTTNTPCGKELRYLGLNSRTFHISFQICKRKSISVAQGSEELNVSIRSFNR